MRVNKMIDKYRLLAVALFSLVILFADFSYEAKCSDGTVNVWLTLQLREYETDMPIANTSISLVVSTVWGKLQAGPYFTDEHGNATILLGKYPNKTSKNPPRITRITLVGNYTIIEVNNVFIEDTEYTAEYISGTVDYRNLRIAILQEKIDNNIFLQVDCRVLRSKIINISDSDPVTGDQSIIYVNPSAKVISEEVEEKEFYESQYLVPLDYYIYITTVDSEKYPYPPLKILIDENVSFINWMYYAANFYTGNELENLERKINWFKSAGLSLIHEVGEYGSLKNLANRSLNFYQKREYSAALNGMKLFARRVADLRGWLSNQRNLALLSAFGVSFFTYGMASILSNFIFEEAAENKKRLLTKILLFILLMLLFSYTNPSSKIACAILIERAISFSVSVIDYFTIALGTFVIGASTYFVMMLFALRKASITDLAMRLGVRGLKRRPFRTILTLITIAVVVSSSILFTNISIARESKVRRTWIGSHVPCLIIEHDRYSPALNEHDIEWISKQEWCENVTYMEYIDPMDQPGDIQIFRNGFIRLTSEGPRQLIFLYLVDPTFMDKYYNLSQYIRGFWSDFSVNERVVIVPTTYDVSIGDYVTLEMEELIVLDESIITKDKSYGLFRVVGKFDPTQLAEIKRLDNVPLFGDAAKTVLLPIGAIKEPEIIIYTTTVFLKEGFNPVDAAKDIAYSFGVPVIANWNGLAALVVWSLEVSLTGFIPYLIPLAIAGLMMYITATSIYEERRREMFTLAVFGLDPRNVFFTFLTEIMLLGLMGTFIGFFGSYLLVIFISFLSSMLGVTAPPFYAEWSVFTIFVALFTGVIMVFLGGYIPSVRARGLSLMGRAKIREIASELIAKEDKVIFPLPIRETIQNGELLHNYLKEVLGQIPHSIVDPHSIKSEVRADGSFSISFIALGPGMVTIPCEIKGIRSRETLALEVEVPRSYAEYEQIRKIFRDLEAQVIGFSTWRDMQLKMSIVREAPKRQKTIDEVLEDIRSMIEQIKDFGKKLKVLESQKDRLTEEIYNEFRQKYLKMLNEKIKTLRGMSVALEPHATQIRDEIKKISVQVERVTVAYSLGEITEEEYVKICSPLQSKLTALKEKLKEIEEIFSFLEKPLESI